MINRRRWQLCSDDHVWMFPPDVSLSTVELQKLGIGYYDEKPYESCIFYANGESEVLARYKTQAEAICGHIELEKKYRLKRCSKLKI